MNRLLNNIVRLFRRLAGAMRAWRRSHGHREMMYDATANKEQLLDPVRREGGQRTRIVHVIGPRASSDGIGWDEEQIGYMEDGLVQTRVQYRQARRCDCGAVLAYDNSILGTCIVCGRVVCKQEGCAARCERCGALVCARHAVRINKHMFCGPHRLYGWWLRFWGMLE